MSFSNNLLSTTSHLLANVALSARNDYLCRQSTAPMHDTLLLQLFVAACFEFSAPCATNSTNASENNASGVNETNVTNSTEENNITNSSESINGTNETNGSETKNITN